VTIDFTKFGRGGGRGPLDPTDMLKVFESLDRKTSHTELRRSQIESLQALTAGRVQRDHVLKVSTGAGKTAVGLLYLKSHALAKKAPVVYLCPTSQLVGQVLAEAGSLGLNAVEYPAGERHPAADGIAGEAIIVCTYKKLFTAKTTFDRTDVQLSPCAFVLDDAHAGIEEVRNAFTIRLELEGVIGGRILELFEGPVRSWMPGVWSGIARQDSAALIEVPYWIWRPLLGEIRELLADNAQADEVKFVWGHLRDRLELCRYIVGGDGIEITPDVPPVDSVRAFVGAQHRLFTSATLADDSALVRELGCAPDAAARPIEPISDAGVGERMVIVPSLIDKALTREWIMRFCAAAKGVTSVVLAPTKVLAQEWGEVGAKVSVGDEVDPTVAELRAGTLRFVAFANRYDGIDLPDDACRILIVDGMPYGESLAARHDAMIPGRPSASQNRLVHRIEQGMGRAVRSHVDYAVVVLAGPELASFVSRREVLDLFNPTTRAQVELARRLSDISLADNPNPQHAFTSLARACLRRDASWKDFYDVEVRQASRAKREVSKELIDLAAVERAAAELAQVNPAAAADKVMKAAKAPLVNSEQQLGWYLQVSAGYLFAVDPGEALKRQAAAHLKNTRMFRPPVGTAMRPIDPGRADVAAAILRWYVGFDNPNGAIAAVQALRARLSFGVSTETFEQAIVDLAKPVGAEGSRPEKQLGKGPDDLWLWETLDMVIECKHEEEGATLPKRDSGQLHDSVQWFRNAYPTRTPTPVLVAKAEAGHNQAHFPERTRVITDKTLGAFLDALEGFVAALAKQPAAQWDTNKVAQLAARHGVRPDQFLGGFTVELK